MALDPQYTTSPNIGSATLTAINNVYDGTGTVGTAFTAGANGSFVGMMKIKPLGTNVASVLRVWINNGGATTTAANNYLWGEVTLPATTAIGTAALTELVLQFNIPLDPGYKITVALGTAVSAGWQMTVVGGDY